MKAKKLPPLKVVNELLTYDPVTGIFTWNKTRNARCRQGQVAGKVCKDGYRRITINGQSCAAGRLAWLVVHKYDPLEATVDHKDRNRDNNAIENLRLATQKEQNDNKLTSKGATKCGRRFQARITTNGKTRSLGCYDTPEQARAVYIAAKIEEHTQFVK